MQAHQVLGAQDLRTRAMLWPVVSGTDRLWGTPANHATSWHGTTLLMCSVCSLSSSRAVLTCTKLPKHKQWNRDNPYSSVGINSGGRNTGTASPWVTLKQLFYTKSSLWSKEGHTTGLACHLNFISPSLPGWWHANRIPESSEQRDRSHFVSWKAFLYGCCWTCPESQLFWAEAEWECTHQAT